MSEQPKKRIPYREPVKHLPNGLRYGALEGGWKPFDLALEYFGINSDLPTVEVGHGTFVSYRPLDYLLDFNGKQQVIDTLGVLILDTGIFKERSIHINVPFSRKFSFENGSFYLPHVFPEGVTMKLLENELEAIIPEWEFPGKILPLAFANMTSNLPQIACNGPIKCDPYGQCIRITTNNPVGLILPRNSEVMAYLD